MRESNNLIIAGQKNFYDDRLFGGISFSEEMIEMLSLPYINFVLASHDNESIKNLEPRLLEKIPYVYDTFNKLG